METLNTTQAAEMLKVHPKTVEDLIHDGTLPAAKVGRAWVMLKEHVLQYLESLIIQQTASRRGLPAGQATKAAARGRSRAASSTS